LVEDGAVECRAELELGGVEAEAEAEADDDVIRDPELGGADDDIIEDPELGGADGGVLEDPGAEAEAEAEAGAGAGAEAEAGAEEGPQVSEKTIVAENTIHLGTI